MQKYFYKSFFGNDIRIFGKLELAVLALKFLISQKILIFILESPEYSHFGLLNKVIKAKKVG